MNLTRRALLQQTSLALASVGLSQIGLSRLTRRYQEVLATPTSRKLALLIGINQYADEVCDFSNSKGSILQGSVTDVELHRELLISRFGFHPSDIVTLQDQQATRDGIETALQFHLLDQVKEDDVVVFHFSGLGSVVQFRTEIDSDEPVSIPLTKTLVPVDGTLPNRENTELNDVTQATLAACLSALPTEKIVSLLDVGYCAPSPLLGNLRVRSRLAPLKNVVLRDDSALRNRLANFASKNATSANTLVAQQSHFPGVLLVGANDKGIATESSWDGFSAGVLTYSLTQNLWHTTPTASIQTSLGQTRRSIEQWIGHHQPTFSEINQKAKSPQTIPAYINLSPSSFSAEGVVLDNNLEKGSLDLWLGGLSPLILEYCGDSSYFEGFMAPTLPKGATTASLPTEEEKFMLLKGRSRKGLHVTAQPVSSANSSIAIDTISSGSFIREKIRIIPKEVRLVVALDHDLERIERVDATSALSAISKITSSVAGEQQADCVFGKVSSSDIPSSTPENEASTPKNLSQDTDSEDAESTVRRMYGIFKLGHSLMPNTLSQKEEAVKTSIHRVTPQLKGLLAAKLLRLTENQAASQLGLEISLETIAPQEQTISLQKTFRSQWQPTNRIASQWADSGIIPSVAIGDHIHYRFNNYSDRPLYCLFINIDSKGNITALYPSAISAPNSKVKDSTLSAIEASTLPAKTIVSVPRTKETVPWAISGPVGRVTTYVITSCAPFTETVKRLPQLKQPIGNSHTMVPLSQPLPIAQAVLQDLHNTSQSTVKKLALEISNDQYSLALGCWGTFNFTYNVVNPAPQG